MRDQVSHPYKTTGKIIVLSNLISIFLGYKLEELDDQILPIVLFLGLCVWFGVDDGYDVGCLHHVEDSCAVAATEEHAVSTFRVANDPNVQRVPKYINSQYLQQRWHCTVLLFNSSHRVHIFAFITSEEIFKCLVTLPRNMVLFGTVIFLSKR